MEIKDFENLEKITYDLSTINFEAKNNPEEFVEMSENIYHKQITNAVDSIIKNKNNIILITGPSSAGKTTTSKLFVNAFMEKGFCCKYVSMDDFFINRDDTPLLDNGLRDYDNITTVDIFYFKKFLKNLVEKGEAMLPHFDFISGTRQNYSKFELKENEMLIVEGLHVLNPVLIGGLEKNKTFKLFIVPNSDFVKDNKIVIKSKKLRLMRRIIRDYYTRGQSVNDTLMQWKEVCKAEDKFITPFKSSADLVLDTTHLYEPLIYDRYLLPILKTVEKNDEVEELIEAFNHTRKLAKEYIPENSLIWEFVRKDL